MTRARRWSPGKGFIRLQDFGHVAIWMKPLRDGALLAAYLPRCLDADSNIQEKWIIQLPRGTDFHWDIFNKPHRIRWLLDDKPPEVGSTLYNVKILKFEQCRPSHKEHDCKAAKRNGRIVFHSHRGYRHMWVRKRVRLWESLDWGTERRTSMPRKIEAALEPRLTQRYEEAQYVAKLREQWAREELHDHED